MTVYTIQLGVHKQL